MPDLSVHPVFVFGSNLDGYHGKGAAEFALKRRGAIMGQGEGHQGNSYAIPTKGNLNAFRRFPILPLQTIMAHVAVFLMYARSRSDLTFQVTPIGCGLAGYTPEAIAPMFENRPDNVLIPEPFMDALYGA